VGRAARAGLSVGEEVAPTDPRVETARLRLLSLGLFLDVKFSLAKGVHRGGAVLTVTIEAGQHHHQRPHFGTSEATTFMGGLDVAETNFSAAGWGWAGGFVASTRPHVDGAEPARAFSLPRRRSGVEPRGPSARTAASSTATAANFTAPRRR